MHFAEPDATPRYAVLAPVSHFSPTLLKSLYVSIRHFYHHNYTATWYFRSPSLRLNGNWLEEAGFSTDTPVMVSVEQGRLVIEPVKD